MKENYEVAHFRVLSDTNFLPYGRSMLENGRKIFKQLTLMEDAMLIHRIMRAPEKRVLRLMLVTYHQEKSNSLCKESSIR